MFVFVLVGTFGTGSYFCNSVATFLKLYRCHSKKFIFGHSVPIASTCKSIDKVISVALDKNLPMPFFKPCYQGFENFYIIHTSLVSLRYKLLSAEIKHGIDKAATFVSALCPKAL